jgi:protease-4
VLSSDNDEAQARDPWTRAVDRPQTMLAQAISDAGEILSGPAIQARCLECGGMVAPRHGAQGRRSLFALAKVTLGL